jgi:hypothetical protein
MEPLRKISLEMLLQILQDLYDGGADYVDISGDNDVDGELRDTIKFTIKPEYMSDPDIVDDEDIHIEDRLDGKIRLSDDDINELI